MESYNAMKNANAPEAQKTGSKSKLNALTFYVWGGCAVFILMSVVPLWNAAVLMTDFNYVFWIGQRVQRWLILSLLLIFTAFVIVAKGVFTPRQARTPETVLNIVALFMTLLGFVLILFSLPIGTQAHDTNNNLLYHCQESEQTHRVYEYVKVLQNIRRTPECANKYSVELCQGYQESPPYTDFIKNMENRYRCTGFCTPKTEKKAIALTAIKRAIHKKTVPHHQWGGFGHHEWWSGAHQKHMPGFQEHGPVSLGQTSADLTAVEKQVSLIGSQTDVQIGTQMDAQTWAEVEAEIGENLTQSQRVEYLTAVLMQTEVGRKAGVESQTKMSIAYPPTLFSDANHLSSCEGMAARAMMATAYDISNQTFFFGVYLVLVAAFTGFLRMTQKTYDPQAI